MTCGVNDSVKDQILGILSFNAGSLPIRYLGVPLISSRLKKSDCKILVEKIVARARSWASRALSYAGRLQLVNSILFAIQTSKGLSFRKPLQQENGCALLTRNGFRAVACSLAL